MQKLFYILSVLLISTASFGQMTDKIETDRPDQTESPFVVPENYLQGEFGFNVINFEGNVRQFLIPTALLKYGVNRRMELRLVASPYTESIEPVVDQKRRLKLEPVELGLKVRLFEEKGFRPKTSIIAHAGLPFLASREFRGSAFTYTTRLTMQHTLSEVVSLGYNVGVERDIEETTSGFYTIAPGFNISERWYSYIEAFGSFAGDDDEHNLDCGIAFNPSPNTKIDLSAGFGLGSSPLKNYVAVGFSFRLPLK